VQPEQRPLQHVVGLLEPPHLWEAPEHASGQQPEPALQVDEQLIQRIRIAVPHTVHEQLQPSGGAPLGLGSLTRHQT
jgi:hypothetical protein